MCGRYELSSHPAAVALAFGLRSVPDFAPRYNIAPMQQVPIVRVNASGERELVQVRWGMVPRRARDPAIGARLINARGETLDARPAFRNAFARHRCLVPVNGFYEWQSTPAGRQPIHVGMPDGRPFGLAGLYERWLSPEGEVLDTCTIVTTNACESLRAIHDRMPVIVPADEYARWLDTGTTDVHDLVAPWPGEGLRTYPVSTRVNAVRNDDAGLCEPIDGADAAQPVSNGVPSTTHDSAREDEAAEEEEPAQARLF